MKRQVSIGLLLMMLFMFVMIIATALNSASKQEPRQTISTYQQVTIAPTQKKATPTIKPASGGKSNSYSNYTKDNDYGYGDPKPGESLPDYIKREDPALYYDMKDSYDSMTKQNDYGYGDPKPGESLSDYIKREDPDLYYDMKDSYESLFGW